MPVLSAISLPRISTQAFGEIAYRVMQILFEIHNEFGPLCDEAIYKRELANRLSDVRLEMSLEVVYGTFVKRYFIDAITLDGGVFELKAVEELTPRHHAQLLNYLFLLDVAHGKLVNMRQGMVQHSFVNAAISLSERREFSIDRKNWTPRAPGAELLEGLLLPLVRDLGTGLDSLLYDDALWHLMDSGSKSAQELEVTDSEGRLLGFQQFRLCGATSTYRVTSFPLVMPSYADYLRRLLRHTPLTVLHWLNIAHHRITLTSIHST